jgi:hypothetical protein
MIKIGNGREEEWPALRCEDCGRLYREDAYTRTAKRLAATMRPDVPMEGLERLLEALRY